MIGHVRGTVAHREAGVVVIDVRGVGYVVNVTDAEQLPARGEPCELFTTVRLRDEVPVLYGFSRRRALVLFELLVSSSGVGPRLALAALGTLREDELRAAIAGADVATLTRVPGIGKKVAERLVLELRDRIGPATDGSVAGVAPAVDTGVVNETRDALIALGYSSGEVGAALEAVTGDDADTADAEDAATLLRRALRHLGAQAGMMGGR